MKQSKALLFLPLSALFALALTSCDSGQQPGESLPSSSEASLSTSSGSEGSIEQPTTLAFFQRAIDFSAPTYIVTNQTFVLDEEDIVLHYHSSLTIDYSSPVKTCYSYSYEKLNEVLTGGESFISTVSNTLYGQGSSAYDGVEWINRADEVVTLNGVKLNEEYTDYAIEGNAISGTIKNGQSKRFFGGVDYPIDSFNYCLKINEEGWLASLQLSFLAFVDCLNQNAAVTSVTTFSYQPQTVVIP